MKKGNPEEIARVEPVVNIEHLDVHIGEPRRSLAKYLILDQARRQE